MQKCGIARTTMLEWQSPIKINDPSDRRKALFVYDELRDKYQKLVKAILCDGQEPGEYFLKSQIAQWLPTANTKDKQEIEAFRIERTTNDFNSGEIGTRATTGLPPEAKEAYLLQSRWLQLISIGYKKYKKQLAELNIDSVTTFREVALAIMRNKQVCDWKSDAYLRRKLNDYKSNGIEGLVSKKWGNLNTQKVDEEKLQLLIDYYGMSQKPQIPKVTKWINDTAQENNWSGFPISETTVYNNLYRPEVEPIWYMSRHGFSAWKAKFEYTAIRFKPTLPNMLWVGDDTKVNLYYKKGKDTKANLNVYAICDAHSGYWLGWSFVEGSAKVSDVRDAFRMAVRRSKKKLPFQMQYDGDSANNFYQRLNELHFPCMPYNGQSKLIERMFGRLQMEFMRMDKSFTGQNIQSTSIQSKINPEAIEVYPNKEAAIRAQELWFEVMNNYKGQHNDKPSMKEQYWAQENEASNYMTEYDERELLWEWNERPIKYNRVGLKMIHQGIDHNYEVMNDLSEIDMAFHAENVGRQFKVRYNPHSLDSIALYNQDESFVALAQNKERLAMAVQDYRPDERQRINHILDTKKNQKEHIKQKRATAENVANSDSIVNAGYTLIPKELLNQAEADLYEEELSDVNAPIKSAEDIRRERMEREDRYS